MYDSERECETLRVFVREKERESVCEREKDVEEGEKARDEREINRVK